MRVFSTALIVASAATAAVAQLPSMLSNISFSAGCQAALLQVLGAPAVAQCLPVATLLPVITSNTSIIPPLDAFMSQLCYMQPCSNATLMAAAANITAGCAADIAADKFPNNTVSLAFSLYPTARELLCLKTTMPYNISSYNTSLGAAPIPISMAYNSTGGYFCVSSILTQLSAYYGTNLTVPFISSIVSGMNSTALKLTTSIQANILCNSCIFGALDIVQLAYPVVTNTPLSAIGQLVNYTIPINMTVNQIANSTCAYKPLNVSMNGTLPSGVSVSIVNSTFPYPVKAGMM